MKMNLNDVYGEVFAAYPDRFEFRPGDRKLIKILVNHVKVLVEKHGLAYFNMDDRLVDLENANTKDRNENTKTHYFLGMLLAAANKNSTRKKGGYRYDSHIKLFASFLRMLIGPIAYETLQKNLEHSLPSLSSTNRYIHSSDCRAIEGIVRAEELAVFLSDHNVPPFVCISEDATRIIGKVQYDSKSNQLVGFVLPLNDQTGLPIPFAYSAGNANQIIEHFSSNNNTSSYLNVIMAQPLGDAPAFCLTLFGSDNKFSANDVVKRWNYIEEKLDKVNVEVLVTSSDSDPRYNSAMRQLSQLGHKTHIALFSCRLNSSGPFFVQDTTHIGTKMRNFLLRTVNDKKKLPFGDGFIRIDHLYELMNMFSKDVHQLTFSILNPTDRQNFRSALRLCDPKITTLLRNHVKASQATVQYLQIMRDVIDSFMNPNLTPLQRVRKIWYSLFLVRIWRNFILSSKQYTLKDNFLTVNCYSCIELNAHALISCMLYLQKIDKPELFMPFLYESQPCESIFRQLRSLSSVYSTVTNCTVKDSMIRISKIQFQNEITRTTSDNFVYPRFNRASHSSNKITLPTPVEIFNELEFCHKNAVATANKLGLICKSQSKNKKYVCKIKPSDSHNATKLKSKPAKSDLPSVRRALTLKDLKNIQLKNYAAKVDEREVDGTGPYVAIRCHNNKQVVVKKTSLCWLLGTESQKLSNDRLKRVMQTISNDEIKTEKPKPIKRFCASLIKNMFNRNRKRK